VISPLGSSHCFEETEAISWVKIEVKNTTKTASGDGLFELF
jgi:hypothetical protein